MSSCMNPAVDNSFSKFADEKHGERVEVKAAQGKTHDCSGMTMMSEDGKLEADIADHVKMCLKNFQ